MPATADTHAGLRLLLLLLRNYANIDEWLNMLLLLLTGTTTSMDGVQATGNMRCTTATASAPATPHHK